MADQIISKIQKEKLFPILPAGVLVEFVKLIDELTKFSVKVAENSSKEIPHNSSNDIVAFIYAQSLHESLEAFDDVYLQTLVEESDYYNKVRSAHKEAMELWHKQILKHNNEYDVSKYRVSNNQAVVQKMQLKEEQLKRRRERDRSRNSNKAGDSNVSKVKSSSSSTKKQDKPSNSSAASPTVSVTIKPDKKTELLKSVVQTTKTTDISSGPSGPSSYKLSFVKGHKA